MVHTVLPANNTISAFFRKHSPSSDTTHIRIPNTCVQLTTHLSIQEDEWLSWLTYSGQFYPEEVIHQLHVMAQGRESSLVTD